MDRVSDFIARRSQAGNVRQFVGRFVRRSGAAIALGGAILVAPAAQAGVPLPVVAQTAGVPSLAAVVKRIAPSVVSIEIRGSAAAQSSAMQRQARNGTNPPAPAVESEIRATGSGVVFDARRGLIITNSHVIGRADDITVKLTDGRALPAQRVGADPETDVAVIRIEADGLTEIAFGDSDRLEVGDFVFAIGNPPKFGQTVTAGIVSGLHRASVGIEAYEDFIQTDAAIYPGNSGGALVDLNGDLVGISTAFASTGKTHPGFGFAIPVNMARALADQMLEFGDIRRGALGFTYDDFTPGLLAELKLSFPPPGAVVLKVDPRSAAERAGLRPGDLVTELGGTAVRDASDLQIRMALLRIGEVAELAVSRRGGALTLRAAMAERERAARGK
jgi:S1-C subfamily serine protease